MTWERLPKPHTLWDIWKKQFLWNIDLSQGDYTFTEFRDGALYPEQGLSIALGPEVLGTAGEFTRVWVVHTNPQTGEVYIAKSSEDGLTWEDFIFSVYVPSGSIQPSLSFDTQGNYVVATRYDLAVGEGEDPIHEIWLSYLDGSSYTSRKICDGVRPLLVRSFDGGLFLFYLDGDTILYRRLTDNYVTPTVVMLDSEGRYPIGSRLVVDKIFPYYWEYQYLVFFGDGLTPPDYFLSVIYTYHVPIPGSFGEGTKVGIGITGIEWKGIEIGVGSLGEGTKVGIGLEDIEWELMLKPLYILVYANLDEHGDPIPLEGVEVTIDGQTQLTGEDGCVGFVELEALAVYEYILDYEDYEENRGKIKIPEEEVECLYLKIYEDPPGDIFSEGTKVGIGLEDIEWIRIYREDGSIGEGTKVGIGIEAILWQSEEGE